MSLLLILPDLKTSCFTLPYLVLKWLFVKFAGAGNRGEKQVKSKKLKVKIVESVPTRGKLRRINISFKESGISD